MKKLIFLLGAGCLSIVVSYAQQNVVCAGGDIFNNTGSVSISVGQVNYTSFEGITEGIQQPYEILILNSTNDLNEDVEISLFPNPILDQLTIENKSSFTDLSFSLFTEEGSLIQTKEFKSETEHIDFTNELSGTYLLKVSFGNQIIKTIKIVKNN